VDLGIGEGEGRTRRRKGACFSMDCIARSEDRNKRLANHNCDSVPLTAGKYEMCEHNGCHVSEVVEFPTFPDNMRGCLRSEASRTEQLIHSRGQDYKLQHRQCTHATYSESSSKLCTVLGHYFLHGKNPILCANPIHPSLHKSSKHQSIQST
jgi:hypothetical protein